MSKIELNLSCYYHDFASTGREETDAILEAVALAADSSHHTSNWEDAKAYGVNGYWSLIQEMAQEAADVIKRLKYENKKLQQFFASKYMGIENDE